jgi:hypothetical protein
MKQRKERYGDFAPEDEDYRGGDLFVGGWCGHEAKGLSHANIM